METISVYMVSMRSLIVSVTMLVTTVSAAEITLDGTARSAIEGWQLLQYAGKADSVITSLAPAAPGWVDSRSNKATRTNVARMAEGVYGFTVLEVEEQGDAAVAMVMAAWTDGKKPAVTVTPFYMWRVEGRWTYLPNPLKVETWYQGVPDAVEPSFATLKRWAKKRLSQITVPPASDAPALLAQWQSEVEAD